MMEAKPIKLLTLDTETRGLFGEIFLAGLFDGKWYWESECIEDLLGVIHHFSKTHEVHVFIHNLDFDLSKFSKSIIAHSDFNSSVFINNAVVIFSTKNGVIFHDSYRLLPASLDKLSKDFDLSQDEAKINLDDYIKEQGYKDKSDFFMRVPATDPVLREYLERDCSSLYKIITTVQEISGLTWEQFLGCPTVASLAMKVYRILYADDYELAIKSKYGYGDLGTHAEEFARLGYYGGRTEVFHPIVNDGYHYDVNSLYPYVMKVNTYPIGWYEFFEGKRAWAQWHLWKRTRKGGGLMKCVVRVPEDMHIPPLPKRHNNKLVFPVGILEGVWVLEEIEMALRYGCELLEIHEMQFFGKRAPIFQAFVQDMEKIKTTSQGAKRNLAKLMQNSLYGKFGMRRDRPSLVNVTDKAKLEAEGREYLEVINKTLGVTFLRTVTESKAQYIQPHIAAYVTAYARILLFEAMMKACEEGRVSYCDTDSMVTSFMLPDDLVDPNAYGKWKLEYILDEGIFIQPKLYYERGFSPEKNKHVEVKKAKGVPKKMVDETFSRATYTGILDAIERGEERFFLFQDVEVRNKFGSTLIRDLDPDVKVIIKKSLNLRAEQKRRMDFERNTSYPHVLDDLEKEESA